MKFKLRKYIIAGISATLIMSSMLSTVSAIDIKSVNLSNIVGDKAKLKETTVFVVGDSTACIYKEDENYALPRAGWGMYLENYLNDKAKVVDLALGGRSSRSFIVEPEYETLQNDLKEGDFVIVQFGHNDAKNTKQEDIETRYTDPLGDIETKGSFRYELYNNYIKLAQERGATAILVSPVSRRKFDDNAKIKDTHVDYDDTVRALAKELNVPFIDMTSITEDYYNSLGTEGTKLMHALYNDRTKSEGIDNTHFSHYGANVIAKKMAEKLSALNTDLKKYVVNSKLNALENNYMTKGEFIATITRALGIEADAKDTFADVPANYENAKYIAIAKKVGIAAGDEFGMLGFSNYITRQEMATIALRAISVVKNVNAGDDVALNKFSDVIDVRNYAKPALSYMIENGYMETKDGKIKPIDMATQEESAKIIVSLYYLQAEDIVKEASKEQSLEELEKVENTK